MPHVDRICTSGASACCLPSACRRPTRCACRPQVRIVFGGSSISNTAWSMLASPCDPPRSQHPCRCRRVGLHWLCIFRSEFSMLTLTHFGHGQLYFQCFPRAHPPRPGDVLQQLVLKRTDQVLPHYIVHLEPRRVAAAAAVAPAPAPNVAAYNLAFQQQIALLRQQLQPAIQPMKVKGKRGRRW